MKTSSQTSSLEDPIVEEIREVRAELAREAHYDLHTICERVREEERQYSERLAKAPSDRVSGEE